MKEFIFEIHTMLPSKNDVPAAHHMQEHKMRNVWANGSPHSKGSGGACFEAMLQWNLASRPKFTATNDSPIHINIVHYFKDVRHRDNDNPMMKWLIDMLREPRKQELESKFPHIGIFKGDDNKQLKSHQEVVEGKTTDTKMIVRIWQEEVQA